MRHILHRELYGSVLGGKHSSVRGGLVAVSLHFHAASDTDQGLLAGEIGDVHEGVVERGENVSDAKHQLSLAGLGSENHVFCGGSCSCILHSKKINIIQLHRLRLN